MNVGEGGGLQRGGNGYMETRSRDQRRAGTILRSIRRVVLLMNSIGAYSASAHLRTAVDALKNYTRTTSSVKTTGEWRREWRRTFFAAYFLIKFGCSGSFVGRAVNSGFIVMAVAASAREEDRTT